MSIAIKVEDKASMSRQDTFRVNPSDVKRGQNARMIEAVNYADKVRDRAISIFQHGQLQPVEVRREEDKSLVQSYGFTRRDAVELLRAGFNGIDPATGEEKFFHLPDCTLWVKVVDMTADEAFIRGIKENNERDDVTDLQEALAQSELRTTLGWTDAMIAREYGYTNQNRVAALSKLLTLPEDVQKMVHKGDMALYTALDTLELNPEERAIVLDGSTNEKGKVNGAVLRKMIRELRDAKPVPSAAAEDDVTPRETEETPPKEPKAKKRTVKDFNDFVEDMKRNVDTSEEAKELFNTLRLWFADKKTDRQLHNAIDKAFE